MDAGDGRVVSNFVVQALKGTPLTIYGDGSQTRSFCYVDDLLRGLMALMDSPSEMTGPINFGNPGEFTMKELADLVLDLTGSKSELVYRELPSDDPTRRCPDIGRAETQLGWSPAIPLREGLTKTIAYFDELFRTEGRA